MGVKRRISEYRYFNIVLRTRKVGCIYDKARNSKT